MKEIIRMKETKNISKFSLFEDNYKKDKKRFIIKILVMYCEYKLRLFDLIQNKTIETLTNVDLFSIRNYTIENDNGENFVMSKDIFTVDKQSNIIQCNLIKEEKKKNGFILSYIPLIPNNDNKIKILGMETYGKYMAIIYTYIENDDVHNGLFLSIIRPDDREDKINKKDIITLDPRKTKYIKDNFIIKISSNEKYVIIGFLNISEIKVYQIDTFVEESFFVLDQNNIKDLTILPSYIGEYMIYRVGNEVFLKEYTINISPKPTTSRQLITTESNQIDCIDIFVNKKVSTNTLIQNQVKLIQSSYQIFILCGLKNSNIDIWNFTHDININLSDFENSFKKIKYIKSLRGNDKPILQLKYNGYGKIISLDNKNTFLFNNLYVNGENTITMNNYILGFNNDVNTNKTRTSKKIHEDIKNEILINCIENIDVIFCIMIYKNDLYKKFSNDSLINLISDYPKRLKNNPKKDDIENLNGYPKKDDIENLNGYPKKDDIENLNDDTINIKRRILYERINIDEIYIYLQYTLEILYKYYEKNKNNIQNYFNTFSLLRNQRESYPFLLYNKSLVNAPNNPILDNFTIYILNQLHELEHPLLNYFLSIRKHLVIFDENHSIIGALLLTIKALLFIIKKYIKFTITTNFLLTINTKNYRKNFDMVILSLDEQFFNKVERLLNKIPNRKRYNIYHINNTINSMKHIQDMSKEKLEALQFFTNFSTKELKKLKKFGSNETLKYKVYKHITPLDVDDRVEARYKGSEWYAGRITRVHRDGTMDVKYDDGDRENRLLPENVRRHPDSITDDHPNQNTNNKKLELLKNNKNTTKKRGFFRRTFNKFKSFKKNIHKNRIKKRTMKNIENKNIQVTDKDLSIVEYLKNYKDIEDFTDEDKNAILILMDKSIKKELFDMLSKY